MNFKWKDVVGLSALVFGLILSGVSLNIKNEAQKVTDVAPQKVEKKITKTQKSKKKRSVQSTSPSKEINSNKYVDFQQNIMALLKCYEKETCNYPKNDPREYKLTVGQEIKKALKRPFKKVIRGEQIDTKFWTKIAITSLSIPDGHVKEAALDLLSTQEPNPSAFEKIISEVIKYHDPLLIEQALAELQKYKEPKYQKRIYETLSQVLSTGSVLVKKEVAENIGPFLNKDSLPYFQNSLQKMNPRSSTRTVLYKILQDYSRQQTGA